MTPPRQWPEIAETHRIEAIALIDRSLTAHEGVYEIASELVKKYPHEPGLFRILDLNKLGHEKGSLAKEELKAAKRAGKEKTDEKHSPCPA